MNAVNSISGFPVFVNSHEYEILKKSKDLLIDKKHLSSREKEIMRLLTSRGVVKRIKNAAGEIVFVLNPNWQLR